MAYKLLETDCPGNGIYRWVMDRAGVGGAFQEYGLREEILNKGGDGSRGRSGGVEGLFPFRLRTFFRGFSGSSGPIVRFEDLSGALVDLRDFKKGREFGMTKLWAKIAGIAATIFLFLPDVVLAAGGGEVAPIVIVADTRNLSGIMWWWAELYNESHLYFALLTIALIPIIGVIFGVLADIVMTHIGIDLKSRDLAEH